MTFSERELLDGIAIVTCPECDGDGQLEYEVAEADWGAPKGGELVGKMMTCELCEGSGEIEVEIDEQEMQIIVQLEKTGSIH